MLISRLPFDQFNIVFSIHQLTRTKPKHVETVVVLDGREVPFSLDELDGKQTYDVVSSGDLLLDEENNFLIRVQWKDGLEKTYETTESFTIMRGELTFFQEIDEKLRNIPW